MQKKIEMSFETWWKIIHIFAFASVLFWALCSMHTPGPGLNPPVDLHPLGPEEIHELEMQERIKEDLFEQLRQQGWAEDRPPELKPKEPTWDLTKPT